jgi:hypothetical protein
MLSMATNNCRGFDFTKPSNINGSLLNCNVVFIREHWLLDSQLLQLGTINKKFSSQATCGFDSSEIVTRCPWGGCAILRKSDLSARVEA